MKPIATIFALLVLATATSARAQTSPHVDRIIFNSSDASQPYQKATASTATLDIQGGGSGVQIVKNPALASNVFGMLQQTSDSNGNRINLVKSRASGADVQSGDGVGGVYFQAFSGGTTFDTARIVSSVGGSFSSGQRPQSILDVYTNEANTSPALSYRVQGSGALSIGTTFDPSNFASGGGGKVLIGSGSLLGSMPLNFNDEAIRVQTTQANSSDDKLAGFFGMTSVQSGAGISPQGLESYVYTAHPSGTISLAISQVANIEHGGAGTVTTMRANQADLLISGSGGGTDAVAYDAEPAGRIGSGSGTFTNGYGLKVGSFGAGFTSKYSVYSGDASAELYNAGPYYSGGAFASNYKANFLNPTATSNGVLIDAGSASSDYALRVQNYAGSDLFDVRGDGSAHLAGAMTFSVGIAIDGGIPGNHGIVIPAATPSSTTSKLYSPDGTTLYYNGTQISNGGNASTVTVAADSTNTSRTVVFSNGAGSANIYESSGLTFNPSTGVLAETGGNIGALGINGAPTSTNALVAYDTDGTHRSILVDSRVSDATPVTIELRKSRASAANPSNSDGVLQIVGETYSGGTLFTLGHIDQFVGNVVNGQRPDSAWDFYTNKANTTAALSLRMQASGSLSIGTTFDPDQSYSSGGGGRILVGGGSLLGSMPLRFNGDALRVQTTASSGDSNDKLAGFFGQSSSVNGTAVQAAEAYAYTSQSGTISLTIAGISNNEVGGSGTNTTVRAHQASVLTSGSGTGTDAEAYYASFTRLSGTTAFTNAYGLYVDTFGAGATNKYSVFSSDSSAILSNAGAVTTATGYRISGAAASGALLRGNGTNYVASTSTYPDTVTANQLCYASATNVVSCGSANLTFDGNVLAVSGFGTHTFSAGGTGGNEINLRNTTAGTGNLSAIRLGNDATANGGIIQMLSSTYTTSNQNVADAFTLESTRAGGMSIAASNASGAIRFYSGGSTQVMSLSSGGLLTLSTFGDQGVDAGSGSAGNIWHVNNSTSGTNGYAVSRVHAGTTFFDISAFSQGYTTGTYDVQASGAVQSGGAGGISIAATNAAGAVRFYSGGTTLAGTVETTRQLSWQVGSAGAPSYTFAGDLDTGIFESSADNITFTTAGVSRWDIAAAGGLFPQGTTGTLNIGSTSNYVNRIHAVDAYFQGLGAAGAGATYVCLSTGSVLQTSAAACLGSSERFKRNIVPLTGALAMVRRLQPITYNWRPDYYGGKSDMGLSAEQVASVNPLFAAYGEDGLPITLNDRALLGATVEAAQEIDRRVQALETPAPRTWFGASFLIAK